MFKINVNLIVVYALMVHVIWGVSLLFGPTAYLTTASYAFIVLVGVYWAAASYLGVSVLAFLGLIHKTTIWKPFYLLPQQFIMMISAASSIYAMYLGEFADGTHSGYAHLIADQSPTVVAALLHTYALIAVIQESLSHDSNI